MAENSFGLAGLAQLIADPSRAEMLAALMDGRAWTGRELAKAPRRPAARALDGALRRARTCYDHLAGELGAALLRHAFENDWVEITARGVDWTGGES